MDEKNSLFFLITPPGLTEALSLELSEKLPLYNLKLEILERREDGGLLIKTDLMTGFSLNRILKTPTRILLRVAEFKARDFPKLFNKIKKLDWRSYLCGEIPEVKATAHESRLIHTERIKETVTKAIKGYYIDYPPKKYDLEKLIKTTIYIRLENDTCVVSLDTSGERLNIRGERVHIGEAPIRENLAYALLTLLKKETTAETLIDPMSGSGTLLLESINYQSIRKDDEFVYNQFPIIKSTPRLKLTEQLAPLFQSHIGIESDQKTFKALKTNLSKCDQTNLSLIQESFQNIKSKNSLPVVIINPPYGERLKISGDRNIYYQKLLEELSTTFKPAAIGIILPLEIKESTALSKCSFQINKRYQFKNGGIDVKFLILKPRSRKL